MSNSSNGDGSQAWSPDAPNRQCWDCPSEEFRLKRDKGWNIAVCQNCGGWEVVENLYIPDENGKEYYEREMRRD